MTERRPRGSERRSWPSCAADPSPPRRLAWRLPALCLAVAVTACVADQEPASSAAPSAEAPWAGATPSAATAPSGATVPTSTAPAPSGQAAPALGQEAVSDARFAALIARISEPGGYFDTDNLISNEAGYLNVMDALDRLGIRGGAYVGVGPDQNFSYIAKVAPDIAFITDVRRDNLLHHLLLKALIERAPTRVEFLAGLHGRAPPPDAPSWRSRDVEEMVEYIDRAAVDPDLVSALHSDIEAAVVGFGVPLSDEDLATIRRFHRTFVDAGLSLRFTTFGRPPRLYYPTYRQLVLETDADGDRASYLATPEAYETVRTLQLANRIVPVVGDLAGPSALREMAAVLSETGTELTALYASNVEFYLWRARTFERWVDNLAAFPLHGRAVIIRSYFPNAGGDHPSSIPGYYSTQTLQPVRTTLSGGFSSYWEVVTRGVVELR